MEFESLLINTRRIWAEVGGNTLIDFYKAINNSDKYTDQEKELAKKILLG